MLAPVLTFVSFTVACVIVVVLVIGNRVWQYLRRLGAFSSAEGVPQPVP